jgi:DNA (cytosine-5)-methyltransferase 1
VRELSLFTGAGGGLLGTHHLLGWETVGYVEIEDYCQRVIKQRIADGLLPEAPIFSDIRAFISEGYAASYTGLVDVITGGFPCQPFSVAGKQAGENDPRNLWPETMECIRIIQPRYALLENVPGLLGSPGDPGEWDLDEAPADNLRYFGTILRDLSEARYGVRYITLGADDVGAPHRRKRLWIMAHRKN